MAAASNQSSHSNNPQFVFLNCKGPGTPHILITKLDENGEKLETGFLAKKSNLFLNFAVLEFGRNEALEKALQTHKFPKVHFERLRLRNGIGEWKIIYLIIKN